MNDEKKKEDSILVPKSPDPQIKNQNDAMRIQTAFK